MAENSAGNPATMDSTWSRSRTSSATGKIKSPNSCFSGVSFSIRRAVATTRILSFANRRAIAAPKPDDVPVTNATIHALFGVSGRGASVFRLVPAINRSAFNVRRSAFDGSAFWRAWRGRVALPRDRRLRVWKLPFADYAAAALYPTFTPFLLVLYYERATPVARERNPTCATRAKTPIRRSVDPPMTAKPEGQVKYRFPWF